MGDAKIYEQVLTAADRVRVRMEMEITACHVYLSFPKRK